MYPSELKATILHPLGIDQRQLYYKHQNHGEVLAVNATRYAPAGCVTGAYAHRVARLLLAARTPCHFDIIFKKIFQ